jgi:cytochrome bd ubiquinol oxidase subunit II
VIAAAVGAILLASVTLYAILGGADFGGGFWDLVAGGDRRGSAPRALIDESITPVWEANHVWLVFALVIFWTAFPDAFASVMTAVALPLWLAVGGIVLRGAGFAFRKEASGLGARRAFGAAFAFSSLLTPFFMGTVVGAVASGRIPATASHASTAAWTSATSLLTGVLFVGACAYLAAVYLIGEAARRDDRRMAAYFTRRAEAAGAVTGALSLAVLLELDHADPALFGRLTGRAVPLVILAGVTGVAVLALLTVGRPRAVRVLAGLGVAAVVWGWGVAQYPTLLPGTPVTLSNAGAPESTLAAIVVLFAAVVVLIGPSFGLLFWLHGRQLLLAGDEWVSQDQRAGAAAASLGPGGAPPRQPGGGSRAAAIGLVAASAVASAVARALARRRRTR